jgi:AsmA-like protein/uncharacterized protein DUF3971
LKRFISYFFRVFFGLIAVFFLAWGFFWALLTINKNKIISKVRLQLSQQMKGNLTVGDLKADFIHEFPYLAVQITAVKLRESSDNNHSPDFINAEKIYVRLKPLSLLNLKPKAGRITFENSTIYFYTDSTGHSNIVRRDSAKTNGKADLPDLLFINTRIVMQDNAKQKLYDIYCERFKCDVDKDENSTGFKIKLKCLVRSLAFNTEKGSYLKNKEVEGKFRLSLSNKNELSFNNVDLRIDKQNIHCSGKFVFNDHPTFELAIRTNSIRYEDALSFLPAAFQSKLNIYHTDKSLSLNVNLNGSLEYGKTPFVTINTEQKKTDIKTPVADFNQCSFAAFYTNQFDPNQLQSDENSRVTFKKFSGEWENVKLRSDSILISNLKQPVLSCDIKSDFDLKQLNDLTGSNTIRLTNGKGELNANYACSLVSNDSLPPTLSGNVVLKNAEISYLPRHFSLKDCNGTIVFDKQNVSIRKLSAHVGNNQLLMNGSVENLLTLLNTSPESLTIKWNVSSPDLDINNFISYIGKRSAVAENISKKKFFSIADKIDRMLKDGAADVQIQAAQVRYKKFKAQNVFASLSLLQNKILLNEARLKHAGGSLSLHGSLLDDGGVNNLQFSAALDHLDIPEVFYSFSNFGQDAITDKNMKGLITANIDMSAGLTDEALIVPNSLKGTVDFLVENGELINFEPVQKISETVFKKRNFAELRFAELKNRLDINGSAIKIPNMEIHSSAMTMFVQGIYDTKNGTDMSIQLPVSNLKKEDPFAILKNKNKAGLSVRLRAHTGEDGKLKVTWDPFNKASKSLSISQLQPSQQ